MYPNVAVRDDLVSVVWVTNDENDPTGESGNYIIKRKDIINDAIGDVSELYSTTDLLLRWLQDTRMKNCKYFMLF